MRSREHAELGLLEYLEIKALAGCHEGNWS